MSDLGYIYALIDPREPDPLLAIRYIGMTKRSLRRRLIVHLSEARKGNLTHRSNWIRLLLDASTSPHIVEIERLAVELLPEREVALIAEYRSRGARLTNGTLGGDGARGLSGDAYEKLCMAARNRSPETREKIRQNRLGKTHSSETRAKISGAWKGYSDETRSKIRESGRAARVGNRFSVGREISDETRRKMSASALGHHRGIGRKATDEARQHMSEAHLQKSVTKTSPDCQGRLF